MEGARKFVRAIISTNRHVTQLVGGFQKLSRDLASKRPSSAVLGRGPYDPGNRGLPGPIGILGKKGYK